MDRRAEEHVYELVQRSAEGHRREGLRLGDRPAGWVDADTVARGTIKTEEATRQVSQKTTHEGPENGEPFNCIQFHVRCGTHTLGKHWTC